MQQIIVTIGPDKSLVVELDDSWSNLSIQLAGEVLGTINGKSDLRNGRFFALPDGRQIRVLAADRILEVWMEGKELVNGKQRIWTKAYSHAYKALFFIGAVQLIIAALFHLSKKEMSTLASIVFELAGGALIGLGLWAKYTRDATPLWVGIGLCVCYVVSMIWTGALGGLIATIILLFFLIRGVRSGPILLPGKAALENIPPTDSTI